jgi:hypothetical protein
MEPLNPPTSSKNKNDVLVFAENLPSDFLNTHRAKIYTLAKTKTW